MGLRIFLSARASSFGHVVSRRHFRGKQAVLRTLAHRRRATLSAPWLLVICRNDLAASAKVRSAQKQSATAERPAMQSENIAPRTHASVLEGTIR